MNKTADDKEKKRTKKARRGGQGNHGTAFSQDISPLHQNNNPATSRFRPRPPHQHLPISPSLDIVSSRPPRFPIQQPFRCPPHQTPLFCPFSGFLRSLTSHTCSAVALLTPRRQAASDAELNVDWLGVCLVARRLTQRYSLTRPSHNIHGAGAKYLRVTCLRRRRGKRGLDGFLLLAQLAVAPSLISARDASHTASTPERQLGPDLAGTYRTLRPHLCDIRPSPPALLASSSSAFTRKSQATDMPGISSKIGHGLAKGLGIRVEDPDRGRDTITRGESVMSTQTSDSFFEGPPTSLEWIQEQVPTRQETTAYIKSLFPFLSWITHYNLQWFAGDLIAGITIGAILVPQGMAYAMLANLEPQFGLYSSFMGVVIYWIFGTSKDISIGPVAVLSTVVGTVVTDLTSSGLPYSANIIASSLSIIAGCIVLGMGLLRLGWLVDLISITSLSAFMTGSSITIAVSQLPALLGLHSFSNRDATYKVFINSLKNLPHIKLDAALGLTALFQLYLMRYTLTRAAERWPNKKRLIFFANTMRTVFAILLYTMISWLVNRNRREQPAFRILGAVPKGFQNVGSPHLDSALISKFAKHLPATVIVMLVEHIAISKSFGRVNNYTIDPSQEMVAIGMTNILGPFLGGYPSTGSFSRTAVNSKAGVRTPAAGIITGLVVLIATYLLTTVFFYIPSATLAAVIIHAVGDLVTPPNTIYQFWRVSPLEVFVFFIGVFVSVFVHLEEGLYATVSLSAAILLFRILKARGRFMGKVRVHSVLGDHVIGADHSEVVGEYGTFTETLESSSRNVFLPLDHGDGSNPEVELENPYPGVFIYRFSEGFNYPNANHSLEYLVDYIKAQTQRTSPEMFDRKGDRPWNNPGPRKTAKSRQTHEDRLPTLKAIILDFSSVNNVDITSVQRLIDVRNQLDKYTAPEVVDWHISCINNRWTKRALIAGGFGVPTTPSDSVPHRWRSIFSVAEIGGKDSAAAVAEESAHDLAFRQSLAVDEEMGKAGDLGDSDLDSPVSTAFDDEKPPNLVGTIRQRRKGAVVSGLDRPLFHVDLTSAVQSAIFNVQAREEFRAASRTEAS